GEIPNAYSPCIEVATRLRATVNHDLVTQLGHWRATMHNTDVAEASAPLHRHDYLMGHSQSEQDRLLLQASILRPWTGDFFRTAGLVSGMRVLDVGCGLGDVSFLAAELVGQTGTVIGIDREPLSIERAAHRAERAGMAGRVRFVCAGIEEFAGGEP